MGVCAGSGVCFLLTSELGLPAEQSPGARSEADVARRCSRAVGGSEGRWGAVCMTAPPPGEEKWTFLLWEALSLTFVILFTVHKAATLLLPSPSSQVGPQRFSDLPGVIQAERGRAGVKLRCVPIHRQLCICDGAAVPRSSSLGVIHLQECHTELGHSCVLDHRFIIKGHHSGVAGWERRRARRGDRLWCSHTHSGLLCSCPADASGCLWGPREVRLIESGTFGGRPHSLVPFLPGRCIWG